MGGTWYWNRYPGIACDVESYVYMPLLEETRLRADREVRQGTGDLRALPAHRRALRPLPRRVPAHRGARDPLGRRRIRAGSSDTDRGDEMRARFVSMANGYLQKPKLPGIEGIDAFRGHTFHTSRWDYGYTGGEPRASRRQARRHHRDRSDGDPVRAAPGPAAAQRLYVFQRTPSSVDVRANRPRIRSGPPTLRPGWQRRRIENFQSPHRRRPGRRRPSRRRLDQHHAEASGDAP